MKKPISVRIVTARMGLFLTSMNQELRYVQIYVEMVSSFSGTPLNVMMVIPLMEMDAPQTVRSKRIGFATVGIQLIQTTV